LYKGKPRSTSRVLPCFELRFKVRGDIQELVYALADMVGIAPNGVELNDQKVFHRKTIEVWLEMLAEASEGAQKRIFHHSFERAGQGGNDGVSVVPIPGVNHLDRRPQAEQQLDVRPVSRDPGGRFLRVKIGRAALSTARTGSGRRRKLLVIPGVPSAKAAQLLAREPPQDRVGKVVDLLVRGEADLRMGFKLGGKPSGPAFGRANTDEVDTRHVGQLAQFFGKYIPPGPILTFQGVLISPLSYKFESGFFALPERKLPTGGKTSLKVAP